MRHPLIKEADLQVIEALKAKMKSSVWNISPNYEINIGLARYFDNLQSHFRCDDEELSDYDLLKAMTPEFQRDNDKWSVKMKECFVENVILGNRSMVTLYNIGNDPHDMSESFLLDGQQRSYAIADFLNGKIKPFGYAFDQIGHRDILVPTLHPMSARMFNFKNHVEAAKYYIEINEGVTHSEADIQRARDYILKHS